MASKGFTLIEVLVVMVLLALIVAVVPRMFSAGVSGAELKAATREVAAGLRQARSDAITYNREVGFTIDVESRSYKINGNGPLQNLVSEIEITLYTAESEAVSETTGTIRFFPDGGSTGGGITLAHGARKYHVMVDWLTGHVSIPE